MTPEFMGMLRESEIPFDMPVQEYVQPRIVHKVPPQDTKQYAIGEFSGSPTSNRRLEFPINQ